MKKLHLTLIMIGLGMLTSSGSYACLDAVGNSRAACATIATNAQTACTNTANNDEAQCLQDAQNELDNLGPVNPDTYMQRNIILGRLNGGCQATGNNDRTACVTAGNAARAACLVNCVNP
jgi:hypothetical protein